jgi:hypothetical protein
MMRTGAIKLFCQVYMYPNSLKAREMNLNQIIFAHLLVVQTMKNANYSCRRLPEFCLI